MTKHHRYPVTVAWTGNHGAGTSGYRNYGREHEITAGSKPMIPGSSDPSFRGDAARWNPEELFVASLAACHKLWYLHLASEAGITVTGYEDCAEGVMLEERGGSGRFERVVLRPVVTIIAGDPARAASLHHDAHAKCFIANSVRIPVICEPEIRSG